MKNLVRFQKVKISDLAEGDRFYLPADSKKIPHTFIAPDSNGNSYVREDHRRHNYLLGNNTNVIFLRHQNS